MGCTYECLIPLIILLCAYVNSGTGPENNIIFERFEYRIINESVLIVNYHEIKPVAHNVIRQNSSFTIFQPLKPIWIHTVLYYKYTRYQKYLIDLNVELCQFLGANAFDHP